MLPEPLNKLQTEVKTKQKSAGGLSLELQQIQ